MATLPVLQKQTPPRIISDPTAIESFGDVSGGIIDVFNDTSQEYKGKFLLPLYAKKLEGYSILSQAEDDEGVPIGSPVLGGTMWADPDGSANNRFHKIFAVKNKIYIHDDAGIEELYDVNATDTYTITKLIGVQSKNNLYMCINDPNMDSALYKYIGALTKKGSLTDGGGGTCLITTIAHSLVEGMTVAYEGTDYVINYIDADSFKITKAYSADVEMEWSCTKQIAKATMTGMRAASMLMIWENRLAATGLGDTRALPQFSELDIYGNYTNFTVGVATTDGGDFYGDLGGINCMVNHDEYGTLLQPKKITFHRHGAPIVSGSSYVRDPDTLQKKLTISGNGTTSPFGAISARGALFYIDSSSGVFQCDVKRAVAGYNNSNINLTESWQSEFLKYDTSQGFITYDDTLDALLVGAASVKDGVIDRVLVYSFRTERWSVDPGKRSNQVMASPEEKKLYGLGSIGPELHDFFDGSYNDDGKEKTLIAWTRFFDGGRRSIYKEYESLTQIYGISSGVELIKTAIVGDGGGTLTETLLDVTEEFGSVLLGLGGQFGEYVVGAAAQRDLTNFTFKQYYNDDPIDDFQRLSLKTEETSSFPFLIFAPEILATPTSDYAEDL